MRSLNIGQQFPTQPMLNRTQSSGLQSNYTGQSSISHSGSLSGQPSGGYNQPQPQQQQLQQQAQFLVLIINSIHNLMVDIPNFKVMAKGRVNHKLVINDNHHLHHHNYHPNKWDPAIFTTTTTTTATTKDTSK